MRCGSYKTILASQSFVLRIIVYCISSHFDYDEITSPSFVMKQHPSVCLLVFGDLLSISSDKNIQIPHSGAKLRLGFTWHGG